MRGIEHSGPRRRHMEVVETGGFAERHRLLVARRRGRVRDMGCGTARSVRLFSSVPR